MKILLIEDEFILAEDLSNTLESDGYEVDYVVDNGPDALAHFRENDIDLVLCDIHIKGIWDGIETIEQLIAVKQVPIIYLTALTDKTTLERAKKTFPAAYISKPYHLTNLRMAIEMAINNFAVKIQPTQLVREDSTQRETILQVNDDIFIKQNYQFVKFSMGDILYLEADKIYTTIVTTQKKYAIRQSISNVLERLPLKQLVRVHRSYAVNINRIESFNEHEITGSGFQIPLGRTFKDEFMKQFMFR
ncbi:LytR/AlgR family response regulator transcription factor [Spirosoma spitsbergense]|uniref:LytR/AlgR family response regulator transcription factor n=1 Tax=Spirosoma spitsbergense TaxID=431554 RepID=UPI00035F687C|nr:response regulator [Spirosoma spitsbergense]